jgi:fructoselysine-6-P-deglycase FrlB-like protein
MVGSFLYPKNPKEVIRLNNLERLKMEIRDINLTEEEQSIYLQENALNPTIEYSPESVTNKRNILKTALSILESIANNPATMKNYKKDDITVSQFAENIQSRIDQLERKIRQMSINDEAGESNYFMMFKGETV